MHYRRRLSLLIIALLILGTLAIVAWLAFFARRTPVRNGTETIARQLVIPWALDFLPDGSAILTERPGRVRIVDPQGTWAGDALLEIDEVSARGEGGLLGVALHPEFGENGFLYLYYTYLDGSQVRNRVVRYVMLEGALSDPAPIVTGIPGANIHNGGRIKFGPDGKLYVTTGDAANPDLSQDPESLAGKILRVNDDGSVPEDNPFPGSAVFSLGHRNPQGLAWDDRGRLWATEHGSSATDELNLILPGRNYGWPLIRGDETAEGFERPVIHSGRVTWAPSGLAYFNGSLYFAGLRSQGLWEAEIRGESVILRQHLEGNFGRLRAVVLGPNGHIHLTTSNRDGRGLPSADDDRLIRIDPSTALAG